MVIEAGGTDDIAFFDKDFHGTEKPAPWQLENLAISCPIVPGAFWVTHGGGLRMVFVKAGDFTAGELAVLARMWFPVDVGGVLDTGTEIKRETRHPE